MSNTQHRLRIEKESCQDRDQKTLLQNKRNSIKKELKKELKAEREKVELQKIEDIENNKNDSRRMFQAVRELNKKEDNVIIVENSNGEIIHSVEEELKEITNYFKDIFTQDSTHPLPDITPQKLKEEITSFEVEKAVNKLKNNKSSGCDNINAELLKYGPTIVFDIIANILNKAAETGDKPIEISLGHLVPLPKPGKPKGPVKNLRPIILLSVLRKVLAIIIVNRTFETIRKEIKVTQAAYSPGRSTTELVFTFKTLIEQAVCAEDLTVHLLLLDMSRAFDTIDRGILLNDLKEIFEPDILHLISLLLVDVQIQVKHKNKLGNTFTPNIGSPQGDCASPIWFIYYLHKALQSNQVESPRDITIDISHDHTYTKTDKHKITPKGQKAYLIDQQYADDASWITTSEKSKESVKQTTPQALKNKNLYVNEDKTEDFSVSRQSQDDWKNCKLVGSLLGNAEDIRRRKQLACAAFAKNKSSLCSKAVHLKTRLRIFEALISSIFLYNSEIWTLNYSDKRKIDTFQRSFLRQIVRRKWIKNKHLYKKCNSKPWSETIQFRRLKWFGHMLRLPSEAPARLAFEEANVKKVKKLRGGQPLTWIRTVKSDFKTIDVSLGDAIKIAEDRKGYDELVYRVMAKSLSGHNPDDDSSEESSEE